MSDKRFVHWMRLATYTLTAAAIAFYIFVLIPNFRTCERETGHWRACTHWLMR